MNTTSKFRTENIIATAVIPGTDWTIQVAVNEYTGTYVIEQGGTGLSYGSTSAKTEAAARVRANEFWASLITFRDRTRF